MLFPRDGTFGPEVDSHSFDWTETSAPFWEHARDRIVDQDGHSLPVLPQKFESCPRSFNHVGFGRDVKMKCEKNPIDFWIFSNCLKSFLKKYFAFAIRLFSSFFKKRDASRTGDRQPVLLRFRISNEGRKKRLRVTVSDERSE